jgi:hypothetical protein
MKIKRTYILIFAFCIGLLFPFLAWVIEISYSDFDFSFSGIRSIHSFNPSLFIADLFPFVLFLIAFIFYDKWTKLYEEYKSVSLSFENQTSNIKNVATFAENTNMNSKWPMIMIH